MTIMRKTLLLFCICIPFLAATQTITTKYEQSHFLESPTHQEAIKWWKMMDAKFPQIKMLTMGPSDAGFPLNLLIVSADADVNIASLQKKNRRIILVNNGIHPGEPD